ncbi:hypothetical protein [Meiothermus hypogaeus]|uniref:Uncharacterized protein n=2 Tax=Meiothermus hypogaeus TaxID=884155 RepID=A0A511R2X2_9DEIN|nr:hypothetical protein [Meiothermus hypogaeus]RIH77665.1 hypothetical protein Mhypo_01939 [Meiothermus hypogaeus]GEM83667.1 hypothetical protein MHY01S_18330 [Meiothermus hypogaeus NBRC 106114]
MVEVPKLDLSAFEFEDGVDYLVEELEVPESVARQMMAAAKGELESFAQTHSLMSRPTK